MYDWQTLISGFLAVLVAFITVLVILSQVRLQKKQLKDEEIRHNERFISRALSAKSQLPDSLSDLSEYARKCMSCLKQKTFARLETIEYPRAASDNLKSAIEFVDPLSAKSLYDLVVHLQTLRARLRDLTADVNDRWHCQLMHDVVLLQARINHAFDFARNETDILPDGPITFEMMDTALKNCADIRFVSANRGLFSGLIEMLENDYPKEESGTT